MNRGEKPLLSWGLKVWRGSDSAGYPRGESRHRENPPEPHSTQIETRFLHRVAFYPRYRASLTRETLLTSSPFYVSPYRSPLVHVGLQVGNIVCSPRSFSTAEDNWFGFILLSNDLSEVSVTTDVISTLLMPHHYCTVRALVPAMAEPTFDTSAAYNRNCKNSVEATT